VVRPGLPPIDRVQEGHAPLVALADPSQHEYASVGAWKAAPSTLLVQEAPGDEKSATTCEDDRPVIVALRLLSVGSEVEPLRDEMNESTRILPERTL
jgi:hypothetical protein